MRTADKLAECVSTRLKKCATLWAVENGKGECAWRLDAGNGEEIRKYGLFDLPGSDFRA